MTIQARGPPRCPICASFSREILTWQLHSCGNIERRDLDLRAVGLKPDNPNLSLAPLHCRLYVHCVCLAPAQ